MKLLVINNLVSGYGEGAIYDYVRAFVRDGDEIVLRSTDGSTDLRTFLFDAEYYDAVVVSGGDGTIATVSYLLADTGIPILPFPAGTANLLTANLASPSEPHALANMTRERNLMDFDMGEIELKSGQHFGFCIMAGAGYDATIMEGAQEGKKFLGQVAYFTSAVSNPTPQYARIHLDIDGKKVESAGVGVLIVNFSKIQFDISVVHKNMPRDNCFDVVILHTKDAFGLLPAVIACILDRSGEYPERTGALELYRGRNIGIDCDPALVVQYDGEVTNITTPFKVRILPKSARFIVSCECLEQFGD